MYEETVWEKIAEELKNAGIGVYPPATHEGECLSEYVVVKQAGGYQFGRFSTEKIYYMFLLYIPRNMYSKMDDFERRVKEVLDTRLYPMIMPTGSKENDYYDDNYKAHMRSFLYYNNVRNKHL